MPTKLKRDRTSEIAIFGRLLRADRGELSRDLAEYLLSLGFDKTDQARMLKLAEKNQLGRLSPNQQRELDHFVKAGHLLALLHAKARKSLRANPQVASRR